ncbi:hypothetical protein [Desulfovibrio sp. MES5]|uniref:hypothetical protein n=1 Tax=Desulfovibrio sp. MES5 TaxID=1899016 RepID=UPI0025BF0DE2|nr:hypothetical protein [Desulfovibrio sp. MES5]
MPQATLDGSENSACLSCKLSPVGQSQALFIFSCKKIFGGGGKKRKVWNRLIKQSKLEAEFTGDFIYSVAYQNNKFVYIKKKCDIGVRKNALYEGKICKSY